MIARFRRLTLTAIAASGAMTACAPSSGSPGSARPAIAAPASPTRVTLQPCRVAGVDEALLCAEVPVPEDRAAIDVAPRRRLHLHVVVLPALAGLGSGTPLFDLDGGPGVADTHAASLYATALRSLRELGDVVLIDQRGTGGSSPLSCPELDDARGAPYPEAEVRACRDALAAHADLRHYGSLDAAADLDAVRAALGYESFRIAALSYGTQLAQVVLRAYPTRVRAAFLLSPAPLDARIPQEHAVNGQRALDLLVADCAADTPCAAAYPHFRTDLDVAASKGGPGFRDDVRHALYDAGSARRLPKRVHAMASGAGSGKASPAAETPAPDAPAPLLSEGVYLSVVCTEDAPFVDVREARRISTPTFFGTERLDAQLRACAPWPRGELPRGFTQPVASDVPVLVVVGGRDPVTPPTWAERVVAKMRHAQVVHIPWMGHLPDGLAHAECLDRMERAFFEHPSAPVDTTCVGGMTPPAFEVE